MCKLSKREHEHRFAFHKCKEFLCVWFLWWIANCLCFFSSEKPPSIDHHWRMFLCFNFTRFPKCMNLKMKHQTALVVMKLMIMMIMLLLTVMPVLSRQNWYQSRSQSWKQGDHANEFNASSKWNKCLQACITHVVYIIWQTKCNIFFLFLQAAAVLVHIISKCKCFRCGEQPSLTSSVGAVWHVWSSWNNLVWSWNNLHGQQSVWCQIILCYLQRYSSNYFALLWITHTWNIFSIVISVYNWCSCHVHVSVIFFHSNLNFIRLNSWQKISHNLGWA